MNPEIKKLLNDIYKSINMIEAFLQNIQTLSAYKNDVLVANAVERRLAIIREALWKAGKMDDAINISDKRKIISPRHILVHDYDLIEDEAIWLICKKIYQYSKKKLKQF